ncbi:MULTISPECIES: NAD(P)H-dependent oxidoreductase [unclassified Gordonia (in: high G+C Gram-positive bacteria)]|uniref:NAD(P)H-dependent oxidoreductase n=1 Tax=unclassified Gordonia (in: high G+C Gram-positive bacteria) TaxID=2657482 RepID=UPI001FFF02DB|nr:MULTISPECIES: NAD(P)H-dependent oxidoreductase [unclassified Gordonia (in: high G+C Gram-positive bacteria)]UQE74041.1 NAD(P)H-dependent oxidoreductase [Gordonia sp. PP30]
MSDAVRTVVVLVGSLRRESVNRRLAAHLAAEAPEGVDVQIADGLGLLPFYNEDIDVDGRRGDAVEALRAQVGAADAVLLVTPEYNGGLPAVLKNAIDWLSRPYGAGALSGRPVGVVGAALGRFAGTWAREDARKAAGIAGAEVIEAVELGLRSAEFDEALIEADAVFEALLGELVAAG